jgi:hypothetical protein
MLRTIRGSRLAVWLVAASVLLVAAIGPAASPADAALPAWKGGINLYRSGIYSMQRTWWWCTAADVQIMRNIADRQSDQRASAQRRYFEWMRDRNRYALPVRAGIDPIGWTAGLRRFVDDRYRLVTTRTFDGALRQAVKRMRLTNLPVALAVQNGNHGWVLHGFTATADPARTSDFRISSVRVTGPLWGRQSRNGYDMRPNTRLTPAQLRRFFTPWRYPPIAMPWDGRFLSIQPVPRGTAPAAASAPKPSPKPSPPAVVEVASPSPAPSVVPSASPSPQPSPSAEPVVLSPSLAPLVAVVPSIAASPAAPPAEQPVAAAQGPPDPMPLVIGGLVVLVLVAAAFLTRWRRPELDD